MGMTMRVILDQLSTSYGQPIPAVMERNNATFHGQCSTANAPEVLFRCIENCAEIAIMGNNPYTDCQLIDNAVHLLLMTGLYQREFEEWDHLTHAQQMWIALCTLVQEGFNVTSTRLIPWQAITGMCQPSHSSTMHLEC
jgi:hypothetical protein